MNTDHTRHDDMTAEIDDLRHRVAALQASETHYRDFFQKAPLAYYSVGLDTRIREANEMLGRMLGCSVDDLIDRPVFEIYADSSSGKEKARWVFERVRAGEEIQGEEMEMCHTDGRPVWISLHIRPLHAPNGSVVASRSIALDITAQKQAEHDLKKSEERYRDLFEEGPVAYFVVGINGFIETANRAAEELLGYAPGALVGLSVLKLYARSSAGREKAEQLFSRFRDGHDIREEILEMSRVDNRSVWISLTIRPVRDKHGQLVASRSVVLDITSRMRAERVLFEEGKAEYNHEKIIGRRTGLKEVLRQTDLVAATDTTVLILGETGTGKELICRAIHYASRRKTRPVVKINCAAMPPSLIESELFGHERGAFTGAINQRQGRFELAHGGTLFLDEIGDMPLETQPKLLRVLQEQAFERVGGTRTVQVDVRVIAATHRDLSAMVEEGIFREDLFYRLNIFPIRVPPLRERSGDIPELARFIAAQKCRLLHHRACGLSDAALESLVAYPWPGNVRELENLIERAVILSNGQTIENKHLQLEVPQGWPVDRRIGTWQEREREHILEALRATHGKVSGKGGAAELLGLKPTTLESKMKKHRIRRTLISSHEIPGFHEMP